MLKESDCKISESAPIPPTTPTITCDKASSSINVLEPFGTYNTTGRTDASSDYVIPFINNYLIDTRSNIVGTTDQLSSLSGDRVVFLWFQIANFFTGIDGKYDNTMKYEIVVYTKYRSLIDPSKEVYKKIKSIPISWAYPESNAIKKINVSCPPPFITNISGSVKTTLNFDGDINTDGYIEYYFAIKKTYLNKLLSPCVHQLIDANEYACIEELPNTVKMSFSNYQSTYNKRQMNIMLASGAGDEYDLTKMSTNGSISFEESFKNAYSYISSSDIHVVPNFLPNNTTDKVDPNQTPQNTIMPQILIDSKGDMVLYSMDLEADRNEMLKVFPVLSDPITGTERIIYATLKWAQRAYAYLEGVKTGYFTSNNITHNDLIRYTVKYNQNFSPLILINDVKAFDVTQSIIDANKSTNYTVKSPVYQILDGSFLIFFNLIETYSLDTKGVTFKFLSNTSVSTIYKGRIDALNILSDKKGYYILVGLHELAHAYADPYIFNNNAKTPAEGHNSYISGEGSKYCIFRYTNSSNYDAQIKQMRFSDEIEQRLSNTFKHTPY